MTSHVPACKLHRLMDLRAASRVLRATALLLVLALPGITALVAEVVSYATGVDGCDDGSCSDDDGGCCPGSCMSCACCAHPSAVAATAQLFPAAAVSGELTFRWCADRQYASGYRTQPFRPPTA